MLQAIEVIRKVLGVHINADSEGGGEKKVKTESRVGGLLMR